jgi:hypothetical protein
MGILRWYSPDIGTECIVLTEAFLKIFKLRKNKEVIRAPV